ncbi:AMY1.6 [Symbiodinium pilosum]|uniref:AMY1.6 protein n=1 Tax=Symbiodinium pilosum TaxID=2952 RepID=A0A812WLR9_SYMPI|nr:AMY1.6 [Symbiodinium pilosum]
MTMTMMARASLVMLLVQQGLGKEPSNASDAECLLQKRHDFEEDGALSGLALSDSIMHFADSLQPGATQDLLRSFRICGRCKEWRRFGEERDGGYLSCVDHMEPEDIRAAYSMGIEHHDMWSMHIHDNFGVPIYQYDCTVDEPAAVCDKCKFFQSCLQGENGKGGFPDKTAWTLKQAIVKSGKDKLPDRSLLMKMDIEGAEWPTLGTASQETLSKFRQLLIEFHDLDDEKRHTEFLQTMQNLNKAWGCEKRCKS